MFGGVTTLMMIMTVHRKRGVQTQPPQSLMVSIFNLLRTSSLTGGRADKPAGNDFITNGYELSKIQPLMFRFFWVVILTPKPEVLLIFVTREKLYYIPFSTKTALLTSTDAPRDAKVQTANIVAYRKGEDAGPNGGSENYSTNNLNISSSYAVLILAQVSV